MDELQPTALASSLAGARRDVFLQGPVVRREEMMEYFAQGAAASELLLRAASRQWSAISNAQNKRSLKNLERLNIGFEGMVNSAMTGSLSQDWAAYLHDRAERTVLTLDALRERGDIFIAHEGAGCPPVLIYDYEVVMDGRDLPRPCNYMLLRIVPPAGVTVADSKRPYVIIDPRAGHGAGIGGFKFDSQVGVALARGNPVYFVGFRRDPESGQTLADVARAEAAFVREVVRRHPESPMPAIIGNCQGGWAALLLAATNPDLSGPVVLNGAPVAAWSGEVGTNPMRYKAGLIGGTWQSMFWSDIGGGVFDGAHLVNNFELLNPSRHYFVKYYDLFTSIDIGRERFLEFEKWWGGMFLMNEPEICWIVEQLFVGNKLVKNTAQLEPGRPIDLKGIRAPIIVFSSFGDNITPPQQALNWLVDTYADVDEMRIHGQRIIYMLNDEIGHLGIFVSAKIAKKEHTEVSSVMRTIESLPPGLYEMKIEAAQGDGIDRQFTVAFYERTLDDVRRIDDGRVDERPFAAVDRFSTAQAEAYDVLVRPLVKAMVTAPMAEASRALHPLRLQRRMMSTQNPLAAPLRMMADVVKPSRRELPVGNPFASAEAMMADMFAQSLDLFRDMRDMAYEQMFFSLWHSPWAQNYGKPHDLHRTLESAAELRALPEVAIALGHLRAGGFVEAVVRMLVLLAQSAGSVRRDRLERSAQMLVDNEPFRSLTTAERARIIHEQTLIVRFAPTEAIETLLDLLPSHAERELALRLVHYIPGRLSEMAPTTLSLLQRLHAVLEVPPINEDVLDNPLDGRDEPPDQLAGWARADNRQTASQTGAAAE
ncbi:DUF3141 domain-containing protein [Methylorubrum rhodesianum]|jgi:pimeloyl-ACP methyl ester carboxylesterase|uniref:Alpha/beta hydrolase n=2 Tax=Methylorubrum TaxID=2282523 RepID=A0A160PKJ9_9HYPH|nr:MULTISPECIES: DUF3141 domain-containing protein [Methylorubrum]BAU94129.1 hypothetical protein MPPM_5524 [Methylorubrum populi]